MRVLLIHNPKAGDGDHETEKLLDALRRRGDDVTLLSKNPNSFEKALRDTDAELLAAAGGDGSVARVVRAIAGYVEAPLLILPYGTANNIATSLGIGRRQLDLDVVRDWKKQTMDVALIDDQIVVEAAGCGIVAMMIEKQIKSFEEGLASATPFAYRMTVDGETREGEAQLLEAMIIRQVGPSLVLAADADPGDGMLDVVIDEEPPFRANEVTLRCDVPWHLDDQIVKPRERTITVRADAWTALVPPSGVR